MIGGWRRRKERVGERKGENEENNYDVGIDGARCCTDVMTSERENERERECVCLYEVKKKGGRGDDGTIRRKSTEAQIGGNRKNTRKENSS